MQSLSSSKPVALEYVPAGQTIGKGVPEGQYEPEGHASRSKSGARVIPEGQYVPLKQIPAALDE